MIAVSSTDHLLVAIFAVALAIAFAVLIHTDPRRPR